jgi:hypothetical protein
MEHHSALYNSESDRYSLQDEGDVRRYVDRHL